MVKNAKFISAIILIFAANSGVAGAAGQNSAQTNPNVVVANTASGLPSGSDDCSNLPSKDKQEDCIRNTARAYPIITIKNIKVSGSKYFDANGKPCARGVGPRLTESRLRNFLKNSVPVSQMAVMNYYGQHGECTSENAKITFSDGRLAHFSLSSEGKVGYLSSVQKGKEVEVFFYYCEQC